MHYQIIDTPNSPDIKDLITWCPITSSKALKISHGESTSYISLSSLDSMNKTNKLKNPLTNENFPSKIENEILYTIKYGSGLLSYLDEKFTSIQSMGEQLDLDIDFNWVYNVYENFIDYKLKLLNILNEYNEIADKKETNLNFPETHNLPNDKICEINNKIAQLKNQLYSIENKLLCNKEDLFYNLQLINICMSRKLDIEIPFLTELNIPDYIISSSKSYNVTKLNISLDDKRNMIGSKHAVLIKNLNEVVKLLSYDYINWTVVWLEHVRWIGYINLTALHLGMFKFHIYGLDQEIVYPNNIGFLELISYCKLYLINMFYVSYAGEIELKGDFNFKSFPCKVNKLVWIIENTSTTTCNQFIRLINNRNFKFNTIILKSKDIEQLNNMLRYLNSAFYYTESNVFTMNNFETGEVIHMYNVHIYKRIFTPLGDLTGFFN